MREKSWLAIVVPGILVAATGVGVGAGDLATASFTGGQLGVAVLWAVVVGAALKYVLTEGLGRWQLATGQTILHGCMAHFGPAFQVFFVAYLFYWSLYVGSALMGACGVAATAILPVFADPGQGKFWFGALHSVAGLTLVLLGGFRLFERVMGVCIGLMFLTVIVTAFRLGVDGGAAFQGLLIPTVPQWNNGGLSWTIALIGGVGGTLTILCYGYWMAESGRRGSGAVGEMRIDLATAYGLTAIFGMAMVIIGSQALTREGGGATLVIRLVATLRETLGSGAAWVFLAGAWGAFFSSLLGVWQSVPYLFADFYYERLHQRDGVEKPVNLAETAPYRAYLIGLAFVPMVVLGGDFKALAKYYSLVGAAFMPFLALALLYLNNSKAMPRAHRNRWGANGALVIIIVFFSTAGFLAVRARFGG